MQKLLNLSLIAGLLCLPAFTARAAGAYVVDDADIVDPHTVQIESWFSHSDKNENLGVADIAYQLLPNAEFTLLNAYDAQPADRADTAEAQVKYQWREGDDGKEVASGVVFGIDSDIGNRRFSGLYAYVPSTWAINQTFTLNADLGWQYASITGQNFLTWGIGSELHINDLLSFVGEVFNEGPEKPGLQLGPHFALTKDLALDAIYGHNITGISANWVTVGATVTF
jgi:hypothetical protein